jgi:Kef-type K+ transport system membrane component KefB
MIAAVLGSGFGQLAALITIACALGIVGLWLRQPPVVAFLFAGIIAGPDAAGLIHDREAVELLSEIGIAVLLFLVGLKLDVSLVRSLGRVALATGIGQVTATAVLGMGLALALGLPLVGAAYVAAALTFSSTIIIVKLLSDRRELDSLYGRIALGLLIVQDIVVVLAMVALSAFGIGAAAEDGSGVGRVLAGGAALLALVAVFIRFAAEPLLRRLARAPELLVAFAIGWAMLLAALADASGLGKELGGLLGGVSLASSSLREAVGSRLASLRDFLILFFFISLGARLDLGALDSQAGAALALSLFVLIAKPLIVMALCSRLGFRPRTGFMAGIAIGQISEFSLIFIAMARELGHVDDDIVALVTMVALVTITASTAMVGYAGPLYRLVEPLLGPFERRGPSREGVGGGEAPRAAEIILFGLGRFGREIAKGLHAHKRSVLGVDFDPEAVRRWHRRGLAAVWGDAADPEFVATLPLAKAAWVVVAIPPLPASVTHEDVRLALIHGVRAAGFAGRIALTSHDPRDAHRLERAGADLVMSPFADAAAEAVDRILRPLTEISPPPAEP